MAPGSPDDQAPVKAEDRVGWAEQVADDPQRTESRFDAWAEFYDADVAAQYDWQGPIAAAEVIRRLVPVDACLLDAGAGTGLVGELLAKAGYTQLEASDISKKMLDIAAAKGVYQALHKADLNQPVALPDGIYDAISAIGISGYVRGGVLHEFVRLLRPGGLIIFTVSDHSYRDDGYEKAVDDLLRAESIEIMEVGELFAPIPKSQPWHLTRIRVLKRLNGHQNPANRAK